MKRLPWKLKSYLSSLHFTFDPPLESVHRVLSDDKWGKFGPISFKEVVKSFL